MKRYLYVLIFISMCLICNYAEARTGLNKNLEVMFKAGAGTDDVVWMGVNATYSACLNNMLKLGGGVGYDRVKYTIACPSTIKDNAFSVFADFRAICPLSGVISFVGVIEGGAIITEHRPKRNNVGAVISPQIGFSFILFKNCGIALNARFQHQYITNLNNNTFGLIVGLSF